MALAFSSTELTLQVHRSQPFIKPFVAIPEGIRFQNLPFSLPLQGSSVNVKKKQKQRRSFCRRSPHGVDSTCLTPLRNRYGAMKLGDFPAGDSWWSEGSCFFSIPWTTPSGKRLHNYGFFSMMFDVSYNYNYLWVNELLFYLLFIVYHW